MVPGPLWISPARPTASTSRTGDLGGAAYVVRLAVVITFGNRGYWRVRDRKWCTLFPEQASRQSTVLYVCSPESMWKGVGHDTVLTVSGAVPVAGGSR